MVLIDKPCKYHAAVSGIKIPPLELYHFENFTVNNHTSTSFWKYKHKYQANMPIIQLDEPRLRSKFVPNKYWDLVECTSLFIFIVWLLPTLIYFIL